jgi:hypothetical protein
VREERHRPSSGDGLIAVCELQEKYNTHITWVCIIQLCETCSRITLEINHVNWQHHFNTVFWKQRMETWGSCWRFWYGNLLSWWKICFMVNSFVLHD